jgi:hypothetical protein
VESVTCEDCNKRVSAEEIVSFGRPWVTVHICVACARETLEGVSPLHAAAPELLAACRAIVEWASDKNSPLTATQVTTMARLAIAKAIGESEYK